MMVAKDKVLSPFEFTFRAHGRMLIFNRMFVSFRSYNQIYMFALSSNNYEILRISLSTRVVLDRR